MTITRLVDKYHEFLCIQDVPDFLFSEKILDFGDSHESIILNIIIILKMLTVMIIKQFFPCISTFQREKVTDIIDKLLRLGPLYCILLFKNSVIQLFTKSS